ncbi:ATP-binding protein [Roseibium limicola]|uniref:ATP-binding protein n=1 Tax=Roseibium limicola TaxID=2816037 RepID=UPI002F40BA42
MKAEDDAPAADDRRSKKNRLGSLAQRLVRVAALWSVIALAVAGFILVGLYQQAGERGFDAQLDQHVKTLLASALPDTPNAVAGAAAAPDVLRLREPDALGEPRFSLPLSGWYWSLEQVAEARTDVLFASASLVGDPLVLPQIGATDELASGFAAGPGSEEVRYLRRRVALGDQSYILSAAIETAGFRADVWEFARNVALTLLVVGIGLVGAIFWQVSFGLKPLTRLQRSLSDVREGRREQVDEDMPRELAPLAVELNALIHSNREVVGRARTHVGNLAHALKTPISVLTNEARTSEGPLAQKVAEQTALMQTQVQHHLERARQAAQRRVIGVACEVEPLTERLARAMSKIYQSRGIDLSHDAPEGLRFLGEAQDLEEMVGNLLDNACKWARSEVAIEVRRQEAEGHGRRWLEVVIEDDGPGLSEEQMREAVKRGRRLDETVPGTGLGLSIVADLAALYGGAVRLERAQRGGLRAKLQLPAADERTLT